MESSQIATGRKVKRPRAASTKGGIHYQRSCRPDVLRKMPLSANVVFDVLRILAMREAVEISIRDLAETCRFSYIQTRRALRRLEGANLIRWQNPGPGRGHRSVFEVRWTLPSFPQVNDPPYARGSLYPPEKRIYSSPSGRLPTVAGASSPGTNGKTLPAKGQPRLSSRAHRWAVGAFRRRVQERWTLEEIADLDAVAEDGGDCAFVEGPDRERAMLLAAREVRKCVVDAFAVALHRAIRRGRIQTGGELAAVVEDVLDQLEAHAEELFPRLSEALSVHCCQAAYGWAGHAIREATDALAARRMREVVRRRERTEVVDKAADAVDEARCDCLWMSLSEGAGAPRLPSRGVSPVHGVNGGDRSEPAYGESWTGLGGKRGNRKRACSPTNCGERGSTRESLQSPPEAPSWSPGGARPYRKLYLRGPSRRRERGWVGLAVNHMCGAMYSKRGRVPHVTIKRRLFGDAPDVGRRW